MSAPETTPPLYLASASPRRSQLLSEAGIAFEQFVVPVDEIDPLVQALVALQDDGLRTRMGNASWQVMQVSLLAIREYFPIA